MKLKETYSTQRRAAAVPRAWAPSDRAVLRDFFTGAGLRPVGDVSTGDAVELVHEGHVVIGKVTQVHGLRALVDLGHGVQTVRGLEDLVPASRDGLDEARRASIREAVRGFVQKANLRVESLTALGGRDYRLTIGHDAYQPPTQTEVLRFVASKYPGVRVLDGETVRPGLMRLVIAQGEGHEIPGLTGDDAHGGGAFDSVQGPDPRGFDDPAYDERDSTEHIGGPGLNVAHLRSEAYGEAERREAILDEWVEARGRRPTVVEYAKVAAALRDAAWEKTAADEFVDGDMASVMAGERERNPAAMKMLDRLIANYLARAPGALDRIDRQPYEQLLNGALQWLAQTNPQRLQNLRDRFAEDLDMPETNDNASFFKRIIERFRPQRNRMFEEYQRQDPTVTTAPTSGPKRPYAPDSTSVLDRGWEKLRGREPPQPQVPQAPEQPQAPQDQNSPTQYDQDFGMSNEPEAMMDGDEAATPEEPSWQTVKLQPGVVVYPAVFDNNTWALGSPEKLQKEENVLVMKPYDRSKTLVQIPSRSAPFAVDNRQLQQLAETPAEEQFFRSGKKKEPKEPSSKHRMPPAAAAFRPFVAAVRSRGAYIEAKMKFDPDQAEGISGLGLKRALSTALERQAQNEWYRYGFLGKVRLKAIDTKKGYAIVEAQSSSARNFPLEFVEVDEDQEDEDVGYV